jgi:hypothetical protein
MGYIADFYCDRCKSKWKVFYKKHKSMAEGDACQVCTDDNQWGTDKMVLVEPHFYTEVDYDGYDLEGKS